MPSMTCFTPGPRINIRWPDVNVLLSTIHFFKEHLVKKSSNKPYSPYGLLLSSHAVAQAFNQEKSVVELSGIEPLTSCVQGRRSPS